MKKLLLLGILLLPFVASAAPLTPCGIAPIAWGTLVSQGGCQAGDLQFTGFTVPIGTIDPLDVTVTFSTSGAQNQYTVFNLNDGDGFASNFQMSYHLAIDFTATGALPLSLPGNWAIVLAATGLQTNSIEGSGSGTWTKALSNGATGSTSSTYSGTLTNNGVAMHLDSTGFTVTDTFTATVPGTDVLNLSNGFKQDIVPEPSTMMLLGGALVGLGVIGRKRRKNS